MSGVNPIAVRRALIDDPGDTRFAVVDGVDGDELRLVRLDGPEVAVRVVDPVALAVVVDEPSATQWRGRRLVWVNERYRLVGLAFGPPQAPSQLALLAVVGLDDSSIPPVDDQPGWRLFRLAEPVDPAT